MAEEATRAAWMRLKKDDLISIMQRCNLAHKSGQTKEQLTDLLMHKGIDIDNVPDAEVPPGPITTNENLNVIGQQQPGPGDKEAEIGADEDYVSDFLESQSKQQNAFFSEIRQEQQRFFTKMQTDREELFKKVLMPLTERVFPTSQAHVGQSQGNSRPRSGSMPLPTFSSAPVTATNSRPNYASSRPENVMGPSFGSQASNQNYMNGYDHLFDRELNNVFERRLAEVSKLDARRFAILHPWSQQFSFVAARHATITKLENFKNHEIYRCVMRYCALYFDQNPDRARLYCYLLSKIPQPLTDTDQILKSLLRSVDISFETQCPLKTQEVDSLYSNYQIERSFQSTHPAAPAAGPHSFRTSYEKRGNGHQSSSGQARQKNVCIDFQRNACSRNNCKYRHKCEKCEGDHGADFCTGKQ